MSLVLVVLTVIGLAVQRGYLERRSYVTVGGRGGRTIRISLGAWRWPLLAVLPVGGVLQRRRADRRADADGVLPELGGSARRSRTSRSRISPTALFHDQVSRARHRQQLQARDRGRRASRSSSAQRSPISICARPCADAGCSTISPILPLGLPGTVMAVGILLAFIRPPIPIYGTIWILLVAYVARFVPLATRSANATFRQIDPSLEEAGRITGASWWVRCPAHPVSIGAAGLARRLPAGLHPVVQRAQRNDPALYQRHRNDRDRHLSAERSRPARSRVGARRLHDRRGAGAFGAGQLAFAMPPANQGRRSDGLHRDCGDQQAVRRLSGPAATSASRSPSASS